MRQLHNIGDILERGMLILVASRAHSGNLPHWKSAKVISVDRSSARVQVAGEDHPRTVRFNMIRIPELEKVIDNPSPKTPFGQALQAALGDEAHNGRALDKPPVPGPAPRQEPAPARVHEKPVQTQGFGLKSAPAAVPAPVPALVPAAVPAPVPAALQTSGGSVRIIEALTPEVADRFLKNQHPGQRKLRDEHVLNIAKDMENGNYKWTGDAIKFDRHGQLIDGQHRLHAVTLSGVTLRDVLAITVNDDEVSAYLDTNVRTRSLADVRRFNGQKSVFGPVIAAILMEHTDFKLYNRSVLTKAAQNEIVENCPYLDDLSTLMRAGKALKLTAAQLAGMLRCLKANREASMVFFGAVCHNDHSIEGKYEPMIKLLVDWLARHRDQRTGRSRAAVAVLGSEAVTTASKVIRAYNAWRDGEVLLKLQAGDGIPQARV